MDSFETDLMDDTKTFEWSIICVDNGEVSIALIEWFVFANFMEHIT